MFYILQEKEFIDGKTEIYKIDKTKYPDERKLIKILNNGDNIVLSLFCYNIND